MVRKGNIYIHKESHTYKITEKQGRKNNQKHKHRRQHTWRIPITNKHDLTDVYKLTRAGCHKSYIGETGRSISIRYIQGTYTSIKYNREDSAPLRIF
jgi:hypothetical protein